MTIRIPIDARRGHGGLLRREGVREVRAPVQGEHTSGRALMEHAQIACQKGGAVHDGMACVWCRRFVNFVPTVDRAEVIVRCIWTDRDLVAQLMTRASELVSVAPGLSARDAAETARAHGLRHLLLVEGDTLLGAVSLARVEALDPEAEVREALGSELWVIRHGATLGEALSLMESQGLSLLPVADGELLCGVLSEGDLANAGLR